MTNVDFDKWGEASLRKQPLLPHCCPHRRPWRNLTAGAISTAKLVQLFRRHRQKRRDTG
ncbi:hypothetical protein SBA4_1090009 [Candidatus Sulfopaludibacter sp. SbA4]|nr:hypothetical protein SBA4_1090009 [Candidatus Sulfopaludibacter sp. SbA4]